MDAKKFFKYNLITATKIISKIRTSDFGRSTPCSDWNVKQLAAHLLYELSWVSDIVTGKTIDEVGDKYDGNLVGINLFNSWNNAASKALSSVENADLKSIAHLSFADVTNDYYIWQFGGELLIHAWDLSVGVDKPIKFNVEVANTFYRRIRPRSEELQNSGLFAPPLPTKASDPTQVKLLAIFGRSGV